MQTVIYHVTHATFQKETSSLHQDKQRVFNVCQMTKPFIFWLQMAMILASQHTRFTELLIECGFSDENAKQYTQLLN